MNEAVIVAGVRTEVGKAPRGALRTVFKLAVVIQQMFARYHRGQTDDSRFATLDERVTMLARVAAGLTGTA